MDSNPQVLVAGAGPTGLTLALTLARKGVRVRIIEKSSRPSEKSRALGVHAGTLELFRDLFGEALARRTVEEGYPAREAFLHFGDREAVRADVSLVPSAYNFVLILEQSKTERILEEELARLGVTVERNTALTGFRDGPAAITATVENLSGDLRAQSQVTADFLVGCDGSHSMVRENLDIPFDGGEYPGTFMLADIELTWPWDYGGVHTFVSRWGAAAFFPFKEPRRYRCVIVPRGGTQGAVSDSWELPELQTWIAAHLSPEIRLNGATWVSRFKVQRRLARTYRKGRIFLAGDAAHVHSPVGGQGMNVGIQDALNLGHKLAGVLKFGVPISQLDRYELERRPVARQVIRGTDFVFRLALMRETPLTPWVIRYVLPFFARQRRLQSWAARIISEVGPARREIALCRAIASNLASG